MLARRVVLSLILADFLALTGWALFHHGAIGWIPELLSSPIGILAAVDLLLALGMATVWMFKDASATGRSPWPYAAITLCTGSAGLLLYWILTPTTQDAALREHRLAAATK